jgi:hypothetical protein
MDLLEIMRQTPVIYKNLRDEISLKDGKNRVAGDNGDFFSGEGNP